jgi:hypothetical protein
MITIVVEKTGLGERGLLYEARLDGEVIVTSSICPGYDAARVLQARGLSGPFQTVGSTGRLRMTFPSIEKAALLTLREDDKGLRVVKWRSLPRGSFKDAFKSSEGTDVAPQPADAFLEAG